MKASNSTDNFFSSRLKDHSPTPPAHLWDQLETNLPDLEKKKRAVAWYYAAAGLALVMVSALFLFLTKTENTTSQLADKRPSSSSSSVKEVTQLEIAKDIEQPKTEKITKKKESIAPEKPEKALLAQKSNKPNTTNSLKPKGRNVKASTVKRLDKENMTEKIASVPIPNNATVTQSNISSSMIASSELKEEKTKIVVEIRSSDKPALSTAANEQQTAINSEPSTLDKEATEDVSKTKKVGRFLRKLKNIKNGEEEVEIRDLQHLKNNLYVLVSNKLKNSESHNE